MKPAAEVFIAGPNERVDRFVEERLQQIDVTLSPLERRAVLKFAPYFRWATDDELRELLQRLKRHADGQIYANDSAPIDGRRKNRGPSECNTHFATHTYRSAT
ncbi:hypothetical protein [Burkholderia pseudomallei]|uniref:hypothetical protein n=1 Tax=Burkholderia pseudomallei TaxID=28450 RepID=UPI00016AFEB2|nr:hypothetical protein [Burkholderia pseudomallei]ALC57726.1 hypothetical protein AMS56_13590 [Burkholderia pseudomallei]MBD2945571.1 hypothetical protein [Burkholderia pseudomallei]MBD2952223.1 hypothetical protein [Burkholderia pseudomallei]MBD2988762.1 hypothetical protein [Burkholderia pseudomallei]MBD2994852.1 hypothetical protein [Burkholderia pseudomallei]